MENKKLYPNHNFGYNDLHNDVHCDNYWVHVDYYNNDRRFVCSGGIHFFMERQEAINYYERELK